MVSDIEIINQEPITLAELKAKIEEHKKIVAEPNFRVVKVNEYIAEFNTKKAKEAQELKEKLNALGIQRIKERQITKIIDLLPDNIDDLKSLLQGENVTLKQEDMDKIVETVKNA